MIALVGVHRYQQVIGLSGDLPESNSFITCNDVGVPVLGTRDASGKFRAFLNSCRHRGSMVVHERRGTSSKFSCMFHGWTYDSTGSLVGIPMREHFGEFDSTCRGLIELPAMENMDSFGSAWTLKGVLMTMVCLRDWMTI